MRRLHRYILGEFASIFGLTLAVLTLVMYMGAVMKGLDLIARGVPGGVLIKAFTYNVPYLLTFSIPVSVVVATLLQFGRLSMDGEFTALRAGGVGTWQIISPVVIASLLLSLVCLVIQYQIAPESRFARRVALVNVEELDPVDLLDEGRFVRFPGLQIYVTRKDGNRIQDIEVYQLGEGDVTVQTIRAERGLIETYPDDMEMVVRLQNVQILQPDPDAPENFRSVRAIDTAVYDFPVSYKDLVESKNVHRKIKDMTASQLADCIRDVSLYFPDLHGIRKESMRVQAIVEAHKRVGLSMACFGFAVLGIPLGIKSRRKESSAGVAISMGVVFAFYMFILVGEGLVRSPHLFPEYIIWVPVIASQVAGALLLRRMP